MKTVAREAYSTDHHEGDIFEVAEVMGDMMGVGIR